MADKKIIKAKATATKKGTEVKTTGQLQTELVAKIADQLVAKRSNAAGELTNPRVITKNRKEIARLHTAIRAAEIAEAKENK
jgi:ribosomal protein L29